MDDTCVERGCCLVSDMPDVSYKKGWTEVSFLYSVSLFSKEKWWAKIWTKNDCFPSLLSLSLSLASYHLMMEWFLSWCVMDAAEIVVKKWIFELCELCVNRSWWHEDDDSSTTCSSLVIVWKRSIHSLLCCSISRNNLHTEHQGEMKFSSSFLWFMMMIWCGGELWKGERGREENEKYFTSLKEYFLLQFAQKRDMNTKKSLSSWKSLSKSLFSPFDHHPLWSLFFPAAVVSVRNQTTFVSTLLKIPCHRHLIIRAMMW